MSTSILDQFEEYFLYHERDEFADELAAAIREPGLRANFLLGLREDALAKLDAFKGRIPNLFANYLRLDHLDTEGGRAAILGPIERYNELTGETVEVEPELVEAVLDQVAAGEVDVGRSGRGGVEKDEDRIEAPYLQLVLERLWQVERERGSSVLRLATLRELGGAESIVRAHLERALGEPAAGRAGRCRHDVRPPRHAVGLEDRAPPPRPCAVRRGRRVRGHARARCARSRAHRARSRRSRRRRALRDLPRRPRRRRPRLARAPGASSAIARRHTGGSAASSQSRQLRSSRWER